MNQARKQLKTNNPTPFKGERAKLRVYLAQMQLYFSIHAYQLGAESDKVLAALIYLEGPVMEWFEPYVRAWFGETDADRDDDITDVFADYNNFVRIITLTFGEVDEKVAAAQKVRRLYQKQSVSAYAAEFQQISSHLDWDNEALADQFYYGLKDNVKDKIARIVHQL